MKFKCTELITGKVLHLETPWGIMFQNTSVLVQYAFPLWFVGLLMQWFWVILNYCLKPCLTISFINYLPLLWDRFHDKYMDPWCSNLYRVLRITDRHVISESVKFFFSSHRLLLCSCYVTSLSTLPYCVCCKVLLTNQPQHTTPVQKWDRYDFADNGFVSSLSFFFSVLLKMGEIL